jgi:rhodanese-related sulfurtransferase
VSVEQAITRARAKLRRVTADEAWDAMSHGALLIDTRTEVQRMEQGQLRGAIVIDRTVLEWRLDPASPTCIPEATSTEVPVMVVCRQGYSSSLAAASLQAVGLSRATDVIGGAQAWIDAGLPVYYGPPDVRT